jgi:hypothetical protein
MAFQESNNVAITGGNATLTNLTTTGNTFLGNNSPDVLTIGAGTGIIQNDFNINSGLMYFDVANNRIGVNDDTPSQALDVTGKIRSSAGLMDATLTPTRVVYSTTGGELIDNANFTFDGSELSAPAANVNYIDMATAVTPDVTNAVGRMYWDEDLGTLNLGLSGGNVVQQVGEDAYYYVKNQTGSAISKGAVVRAAGTLGASGRITVALMIGDNTYPEEYFMGVAAENIANGADGWVQWFGSIKGVNTTGSLYGETWADGDVLYLSPTTLGGLTKVVPTAPNQKTIVAIVIHAASNGTLFVRPSIQRHLHDLNDVNAASPANNEFLRFDSVSGYWKNISLVAGTNISITNGTSSTTISATAPASAGSFSRIFMLMGG